MKRTTKLVACSAVALAVMAAFWLGYWRGKRGADRWWERQPTMSVGILVDNAAHVQTPNSQIALRVYGNGWTVKGINVDGERRVIEPVSGPATRIEIEGFHGTKGLIFKGDCKLVDHTLGDGDGITLDSTIFLAASQPCTISPNPEAHASKQAIQPKP